MPRSSGFARRLMALAQSGQSDSGMAWGRVSDRAGGPNGLIDGLRDAVYGVLNKSPPSQGQSVPRSEQLNVA